MTQPHDRSPDVGPRLVLFPDELIATFFLPLPEPLGLPPNWYQRTYLPPGAEAVSLLKASGVDYYFGSDARDPGDAEEEAAGRVTAPEDWSDCGFLSSSIMAHHTQADFAARQALDAASLIAGVATDRGARSTSDTPLSVLRNRAEYPEELIRTLDDAGIGEVTVLEVAIPTRLFGTLTTCPDPIPSISADKRPHAGSPDTWTFVKGSTSSSLPLSIVQARLSQALDVGIRDVQSIERAYHALRREPITLLNRERLPHVVPVVIRRQADIAPTTDDQEHEVPAVFRGTMEVNQNYWSALRPAVLTQELLAALPRARKKMSGGAFSAHLDLHREADVALRRQGDTRLAALLTGLAAESLLDDILLHLRWEQALTPEAAAKQWRPGLDSRVKNDYAPLLGGQWNIKAPGPVASWSSHVAELRHRVAHGGYTPSHQEARTSLLTLNELVSHLCDRLAQPQVLSRFPRTATLLAGEAGLQRRKAFTNRVRDLGLDRAEPDWEETCMRWREAHRRIRRDDVAPRAPSADNANLLMVRHPDGTETWCLHERKEGMAQRVEPDLSAFPSELQSKLPDLRRHIDAMAAGVPISSAFEEEYPARPLSDWVEEYHLVPMAGVMVDRTDFTVP